MAILYTLQSKKNFLKKNNFIFSTFQKITVGGFVNQLIKNSGLNVGYIQLVYTATNPSQNVLD